MINRKVDQAPVQALLPPKSEMPEPQTLLAPTPAITAPPASKKPPITKEQIVQLSNEMGLDFASAQFDSLMLLLRVLREEGDI